MPLIMKKPIIVASLAVVFLAPAPVYAQQQLFNTDLHDLFGNNQVSKPINVLPTTPKVEAAKPPVVEPPKAPEPVIYTVVEGDNLTKIGTQHSVEWQRIWSKNTNIAHPDVIHIGDKLTIPDASEVIAARELPAVVAAPVVTPGVELGPPHP